MENNPLFIDTNILIDLLDDTRQTHNSSKELIQNCFKNDIEISISDDIITTVYYVSQKSVSKQKLLSFIRFLQNNFEILCFNESIILEAIEICEDNLSYDFEDTLQAVCAKYYGFNTIVTNDKKFPKIEGLELINVNKDK